MTRLRDFLLATLAESWEIVQAMRAGWRDGLRPVERPEWWR